MPTQTQPLTPAQMGMLYGGIVLLVVSLGLLVYCVVTRRSYKLLIGLFPVAIVMIGFGSFTTVKLPGGLEFDFNDFTNLTANPTSSTARAAVDRQLDSALYARQSATLTASNRTRLNLTLANLEKHTNLPPESRITMARLQLLLGHTNDASNSLRYVIRVDPGLRIDPQLKQLTRVP